MCPRSTSGSARWSSADCRGTAACPPRCPRFVDKEGVVFHVRPFDDGDREALARMYRTFDPAQRSQGVPPVAEDDIDAWLSLLLDEGRNFVAVHDGRIAGHSLYTPLDADQPEFAVFVHQDYQHRGLGTELTRQAVAHAHDGGHDALVLEVSRSNHVAIHVYRKIGFDPVDRGRELHMRMELVASEVPTISRPRAKRA